jgi:hypothetical protein
VNLVDDLHAIAAALERESIPYAVCGGVAVTIHGATRTNKGIDMLVRRSDVVRVLDAVRPLGYAFAALPMTFDAVAANERHAQRVTKIESDRHLDLDVDLDLMLDEGALAGLLDDRITIDLPRGPLQVVSRSTLLAMKQMAGRAQDLADIEKLEADDGLSPWAVAQRLEKLRAAWVAENSRSLHARLRADAACRPATSLAIAAAARLDELRALLELTQYLHRGTFRSSDSSAS